MRGILKVIFILEVPILGLLWPNFGAAEPGANSSALVIEQAQKLALKKNRAEASDLLRHALEEESLSSKSRIKLTEALGQISKMFFTDKGQKIFEAAQSIMWDRPEIALTQFKEALDLEDQNIQILNNVSRLQLHKQDCDGALQTIQTARKLNPFASDSAVLELRALACKSSYESMREKARNMPSLDKWEESFVQFLLAGDWLQQKSTKRAYDAYLKLTEEQPQFPESYLMLSRAAVELGKDNEPFLQKYISLCKAVGPREKKKFALEPRLCANLKEAEDELAKQKTL